MAATGALLLANAGVYLRTTLRGKLRIWERELDRAGLRGDERLLDLGCGRGAVLIAAASLSHTQPASQARVLLRKKGRAITHPFLRNARNLRNEAGRRAGRTAPGGAR